jgi:hypothetical protein
VLEPALTLIGDLTATLRTQGHATLGPEGLEKLTGVSIAELDALKPSWNDLPPDAHLRDGGRYRRRRHACFIVEGDVVALVPHRAHWQSIDYNALHGGFERWFEPIDPAVLAAPAWNRLLAAFCACGSDVSGKRPWFVEAHQFRIDTTDGIGRPTPEGAHRDGVDFVMVVLIDREGVKGGETRVFESNGPAGLRFTMTRPWTTLIVDDERVIHESTPIQPIAEGGHRDTLVLTMRRDGFQGPKTSDVGLTEHASF